MVINIKEFSIKIGVFLTRAQPFHERHVEVNERDSSCE